MTKGNRFRNKNMNQLLGISPLHRMNSSDKSSIKKPISYNLAMQMYLV